MNTEEIKTLIEKFFDGETSLNEEQRLYEFFSRAEVPEELMSYRELFADLGAASAKPQPDAVSNEAKSHVGRHPQLRTQSLSRVLIGMAASLLLLMGAFWLWNLHQEQRLAVVYEGSYVIVNGKKSSDLRKIKPQIEATLTNSRKIEKEVEAHYDMIEDAEKDVLNNIDDPAERERIDKLLKE
jgi:hypothetical protein